MDSDYLRNHLGSCLKEALGEVVEKRPHDPIEYLAQYLYKYQENELYNRKLAQAAREAEEEKSEFVAENETERICGVERKIIKKLEPELINPPKKVKEGEEEEPSPTPPPPPPPPGAPRGEYSYDEDCVPPIPTAGVATAGNDDADGEIDLPEASSPPPEELGRNEEEGRFLAKEQGDDEEEETSEPPVDELVNQVGKEVKKQEEEKPEGDEEEEAEGDGV